MLVLAPAVCLLILETEQKCKKTFTLIHVGKILLTLKSMAFFARQQVYETGFSFSAFLHTKWPFRNPEGNDCNYGNTLPKNLACNTVFFEGGQ